MFGLRTTGSTCAAGFDDASRGALPSPVDASERARDPIGCFDQAIRRLLHEKTERLLAVIEAVGREEPGNLLLDPDSFELDAAFHVPPARSNPWQ